MIALTLFRMTLLRMISVAGIAAAVAVILRHDFYATRVPAEDTLAFLGACLIAGATWVCADYSRSALGGE